MKRWSQILIAIFLLQLALTAYAQEEEPFEDWFWHVSGAGSVYHHYDEGDPYRLSAGAGHPFLHDDLDLIANAVYTYYDVNGTAFINKSKGGESGKSHSLGIDLCLRWTFHELRRASLYIEGGSGFQYMLTDPNFPTDGSRENFTLLGGPGILVPVTESSRLSAALQWFHISNGGMFPNNSGYDGVQLILGWEWSL